MDALIRARAGRTELVQTTSALVASRGGHGSADGGARGQLERPGDSIDDLIRRRAGR